MSLFARRRFPRASGGGYGVRLRPEERALLASLPAQLEALLVEGRSAATTRLFPPAYASDPELDAEYQHLMGDELVRSRLEALATVRDTIDRDHLTEEELQAWVGAFNSIRLVLGTVLDLSEDRDVLDVDPDADDIAERVVYAVLSELVEEAVIALSTALPPPNGAVPPPASG